MTELTPGVELFDPLQESLESGSVAPWRKALEEQPAADPFKAIRHDAAIEAELLSTADFDSLARWFKGADEWVDGLGRQIGDHDVRVEVLRIAWDRFRKQLQLALREAREPCGLQKTGGVLAYLDGLEQCLVIDFMFVDEMPQLHVIDAIENPRSAFDVVDDLLRRDHPTRNELKRMLQSSHRLIWHRDVLCHVDRRNEPQVFGPSIDTLQVAELLAGAYLQLEAEGQPKRALEVGTGSGFISAGLARHLPELEQLLGVESEIGSAHCTYRNIHINDRDNRAGGAAETAVLISHFQSDLVAGKFDLIVCNPPYIPKPPDERVDPDHQRTGAVAGLELIDELLAATPGLLSSDGRLLLLVSSVTPPDYVRDHLPENLAIEEEPFGEEGAEVLFEVEEVFTRRGYLPFLTAAGGLKIPDDPAKSYTHWLHAFWIRGRGGE